MTSLTLEALVEAFDFVNWGGGGSGGRAAYVCRRTGEIHYHAPDFDDDVPEDVDIEDPSLYAAVPDKHDLDLGNQLPLDFAVEKIPDLSGRVRAIFGSRGAYARFKDLMESVEMLEAWYEYESQRVEQALREWCEAEGLALEAKSTGDMRPEQRSTEI